MTKPLIRVAVTGGAGQIAYSLLFRIASGEMFGKEQPVALHILEIESALPALEGVRMELEDCAFPLLKEVYIGSDPKEIFKGVQYALLVGSKPRGPGMERKDLLLENGKIFVEQGQALNDVSDANVKVLVVGNPCNTNCLIAMSHAPRIPVKNFHAMTRLDQNRAKNLLALKAGANVSEVRNVIIWGNHSANMVPDYTYAKIGEESVSQRIQDHLWLEKDFFEIVQRRGAAIIAARGKSSAASAASAAIDAIKSLIEATPTDNSFSTAILSDNNPYGVQDGLIFSFPCRMGLRGNWEIIPDLIWNDFIKYKIKVSEKELLEEKEMIKDLLGSR